MASSDKISSIVEEKRKLFIEVSDKIWDYAETRFQEYKSAELICSVLEKEGFTVIKGMAGMETAFTAEFGSGEPRIGILGEYDALYGLNQKAGILEIEPVVENGSGHGCGHNALGAGSLAAAVAVKDYMKENNIRGTVVYYGCPAEEGGSGKTYMVKDKIFNGLDAAFTWHPGSTNNMLECSSLANIQIYFKFYGVSAHAGAAPHLGRSALDAVELMNVGCNYLREHMIPEARIHYAVSNTGGLSPNVVQSKAEVLYLIRAPKIEQVKEIYERVENIAKGAALMTGTTYEVIFDRATSNLVMNDTLNQIMYKKMLEVGVPLWSEEDKKFAEKVRTTLTEAEKKNIISELGKKFAVNSSKKVLADFIKPYELNEKPMSGSTDVGDVSWVVPTSQCMTACFAMGTPLHSWQAVAQGKSELNHKGMLMAGKVMALSALELFENTEIIKKAKDELKETLEGKEYVCPIPPGAKPNLMK